MVDLNVANVTMDSKSAQRHKFWSEKLLAHLNSNAAGETYLSVGNEHLVGILLCVFVRAREASNVSDAQMLNVPCGAMGVMGNKGGTVCRLRYYDSWVCFVCAHLAAHRGNVEGRNANVGTIMDRAAFGEDTEGLARLSQFEEAKPNKIMDHEFVFFLGDLNYRVSAEVDIEEVFWKCMEEIDTPFLLSRDQLNIERRAGRVLEGFEEPPITFMPTYKYEPGSDRYEMRENKKRRAPAWCDRVLWHSKRPERVGATSYVCTMGQRISDHKPVAAQFALKARRVDQTKAGHVLSTITRTLDRWENAAQPQVELSSSFLRFGAVRYGERKCVTLELRNVGQTPAVFRFVPKDNPDTPTPFVCKHWLALEPAYGMILPEETKTINMFCSVDAVTGRALSLGEDTLDDILILRLEGGRDCFVDIGGEYLRSCFGASLEELVTSTTPMRELPIGGAADADGEEGGAGEDGQVVQAVPKELWRVLDALHAPAVVKTSDLFFGPAVPEEVAAIREALDTGGALPEACSPHSLAEVLLTFLMSLASPIIPQSVAVSLEAEYTTQNLQPWTRRFLEQLPAANYNSFVYLVSFFRYLLDFKANNRLTPTKIASSLSKILMAQLPDADRTKSGGGLLLSTYDDVLEGTEEMSELAVNGAKGSPMQRRNNLDMIIVHLLTTSVI
mmetsp:Transcript_3071/g.8686  ORF Transcript_3071/g.8686 Transcript_3071/m.8686 type:complete len:672 (-) Transcript_3071:233-2248(-)